MSGPPSGHPFTNGTTGSTGSVPTDGKKTSNPPIYTPQDGDSRPRDVDILLRHRTEGADVQNLPFPPDLVDMRTSRVRTVDGVPYKQVETPSSTTSSGPQSGRWRGREDCRLPFRGWDSESVRQVWDSCSASCSAEPNSYFLSHLDP